MAIIQPSQLATGSYSLSGSFSGSFQGTITGTSSYALTASYVNLASNSYTLVQGNGTPSQNGTSLIQAYNNGISATPNGLPLSDNNRYTILLTSGKYQLSSPLTLSASFVDLVSLSGQKDVFITASSTPILVLTDNIKLVGISVEQYDLTILYELVNVIVENCGNNLYTIQRDTSKETKNYYFAWSRTSGEPYPLASTNGYVTYLNVDISTYGNMNKEFTFTINGSVRVKDMGYSLGSITGGGNFYSYGQAGQTIIPGYGVSGNAFSNLSNINATIYNGSIGASIQANPIGPNVFLSMIQLGIHAFVVFSGNPNSLISDASVTNNLGGTAEIVVNTGTNVLYLVNLSGSWIGATTITGVQSSDTRNIVKFSDTLELNVKTELTFTSDVNDAGYSINGGSASA
jgi:hypothetical protein